MKDNEKDAPLHKLFELGPKYKAWRETNNLSLEQVSELSGMEIDRIVKLENGEICLADEMMTYHEFFFKHIPHAKELYTKFSDELLAKHGYTYDEEGNEYYHGKRDDTK